MQLSKKQKKSSWIFCFVLEIYNKFWTFWKKRCLSQLIYFRNYDLRNTWLDKCLKSEVSEDRSRVDMPNGRKYCWILHAGTFVIFSHHTKENKVGKCLS